MAASGAAGGPRSRTGHRQGHGAAGHDEMLRAGAALARVEMGLSLGLLSWAPPSDPPGVQLPAQSGTLGCDVGAHTDVRGHHCGVGFLVRDPAHAVHLALRLPQEQVASFATHEVCGRPHTISEATSLLIGWLESGLDFHVSKDENGKEGKSVVLASNQTLKEMLAAKVKPLGMRVVSHARLLGVDSFGAGAARRRKTQYGRLDGIKKRMPKVKFFRKYGAVTSKIAKAGFLPSGLHGVRCLGLPPTRVKGLRTTIGQCLPGKHAGRSLTWRLAVHECDPIHACRVEPIVAWPEAVWDEQLGDSELHKAWRQQQRLVGLKPMWS